MNPPMRSVRASAAFGGLALCVVLTGASAAGQAALGGAPASAPQRLTIPYLANATRPDDLDFAAAQCEVSGDRQRMDCNFRQVFLTASPIDDRSCVITTNGYARSFRRETSVRWTSREDTLDQCGSVETTTLDDGGGTHWTMTIRTATKSGEVSRCGAAPEEVVVYSWKGAKRNLPCRSIEPGAIER